MNQRQEPLESKGYTARNSSRSHIPTLEEIERDRDAMRMSSDFDDTSSMLAIVALIGVGLLIVGAGLGYLSGARARAQRKANAGIVERLDNSRQAPNYQSSNDNIYVPKTSH